MFTKGKKTALVTGASLGMGKSIAKRLILDGYQVYVAAHSVDKMADLEKLGAQPLRVDVSKDEEIVAGVEAILAQTGGQLILPRFPRMGGRHATPMARYPCRLCGRSPLRQAPAGRTCPPSHI